MIISLLFLFSSLHAQLDFDAGTTDRLECTNIANVPTVGTVMAWIYPDAFGNNDVIMSKFVSGSDVWAFVIAGTSGDFKVTIQRTTANLEAVSNTTPLVSGQWNFVAATWNINGANGDQQLFWGDLNTAATEVGGYSNQAVGSGTVNDGDAANWAIGNADNGANNLSFDGKIGMVSVVRSNDLTVSQIAAFQYYPATKFSTSINIEQMGPWYLGMTADVTDQVPDMGGGGFNCTPTGLNSTNVRLPLLYR